MPLCQKVLVSISRILFTFTRFEFKTFSTSLGAPSGSYDSDSYSYTADKLNRTGLNHNGVATSFSSPSAVNQYGSVAGQGMSYDTNFNLTLFGAWGAWYYNYNAQNQLTSGGSGGTPRVSFTYDGLGR